jgi:nuclear pore complex protein Nup85
LEYKEPIIPSKETFIILHHLEANWLPLLEKKKNSKITNEKVANNLVDSRTSEDSNLISLLRLACARNLSRAFIIEKSMAM